MAAQVGYGACFGRTSCRGWRFRGLDCRLCSFVWPRWTASIAETFWTALGVKHRGKIEKEMKVQRHLFRSSSTRFFNVHNRIIFAQATHCVLQLFFFKVNCVLPQLHSTTTNTNSPSIGAMTVDTTSIVCMTVIWWQINNCSLPQKSTHNFKYQTLILKLYGQKIHLNKIR